MAKRKETLSPEYELTTIEAQLAGTLKPVAPPRDIVNRLRMRMRIPDRREIQSRLSDWRRLFVVFGGVMSGMLLLVTLARTLYYFAARRSI
jgi:hypothetical protein